MPKDLLYWGAVTPNSGPVPFWMEAMANPKDKGGIMKKRKPNIEIGHYRGSPYWGVWVDSELLAVVCYRKGAEAIKSALLNH